MHMYTYAAYIITYSYNHKTYYYVIYTVLKVVKYNTDTSHKPKTINHKPVSDCFIAPELKYNTIIFSSNVLAILSQQRDMPCRTMLHLHSWLSPITVTVAVTCF